MKTVVVVVGADADARIADDQALVINGFPTPAGQVNLIYRTHHSEEGYETPVPREMWIDVRGDTDALFIDAIAAFSSAAAQFLPSIAVASNVYVGDAEPKFAFDATPTAEERDYFTSFVAAFAALSHMGGAGLEPATPCV